MDDLKTTADRIFGGSGSAQCEPDYSALGQVGGPVSRTRPKGETLSNRIGEIYAKLTAIGGNIHSAANALHGIPTEDSTDGIRSAANGDNLSNRIAELERLAERVYRDSQRLEGIA